jgi:hypothetical protein
MPFSGNHFEGENLFSQLFFYCTFLFAGVNTCLNQFSGSFSFMSGISQRCLWVNAKSHQVLFAAKEKAETSVFGAVRVYQQKHAIAVY